MKQSNNHKLVCGVGMNDADYKVQDSHTVVVGGKHKRKRTVCPFYRVWSSMLNRVYSDKYHIDRPTYIGCSVVEEWKTFSNFKAWMETQDWENKALDKDILVPGNKVYGPETCVFVEVGVNSFLNDHGAERGLYPIGVSFHKQRKQFQAYVNNPFTKKREHLGLFKTPEEAHMLWLKRKIELATQLAGIQTDCRVAKSLINRYTELTLEVHA